MDAFSLVVASLAVYRLSRAITRERGPGDLFTRIQTIGPRGGWLNDGLNCPLCVGFWLGLVAALLVYLGWTVALLPFAISGLATLITLREQR